ncbi:MAG: 2-hydroxyacid dehydrogenase [Flavisolibacter sp.]|jgi:D-lactate dehydrogenase|nr:2-hydroxyacid dehydrogenase [Flavisolibacter sp.]
MKTAIFSAHKFEKEYYAKQAAEKHDLLWIEAPLSEDTVMLAHGCKAVCIFANDDGSEKVIKKLGEAGIEFLVLRSAGFNHVDLKATKAAGIKVARVPEYSPYAVAEHSVALMLALNRKLIKANNRIRDGNFSLDGLTGFDMHGKTVGIIGLGKIGKIVASIVHGFGCNIVVYDPSPDRELEQKFGVIYTDIDSVCKASDIITLHAPLTSETKYLVNKDRIELMKKGVMLINTGRGGLVNTRDVIAGLKSCKIGYLGLDVYEEEKGLFFEDHSGEVLQDDVIARLMTFQNVLITSHQAFLTNTALANIADITISNLNDFEAGKKCVNEIDENT